MIEAIPQEGMRFLIHFAGDFQFCSSVMGEVVASTIVLIRKRPSCATSYCILLAISRPPLQIRVWNSAAGAPG